MTSTESSNIPSRTVLVTGATGKQGGATIDALLSSSMALNIIAVTRSKDSPSAKRLAARPHLTVLEGDLNDPSAIFAQAPVGSIWGVYGVQINTDAEESQGTSLIDAAISHGVQHFVYSSGDRGGPEKSEVDPTFVKNFAAKFRIEKHLRESAAASTQQMTYTILRPVTFFENLTTDLHGKGFTRMWEQMGSKPLQMIATKDIGIFAARAFLEDHWRNAAISLAGDELTQVQAGKIFKEVTGKEMAMAPCLIGSTVKFAKKDTVGDMFRWFEEVGYGADVQMCRSEVAGMMDFKKWLEQSAFARV